MKSKSIPYPYEAEELAMASEQPLDPYHRELMAWAASRIIALEYAMETMLSVTGSGK